MTAAGTTDAVQPTYDTTIGNPTTDGTAMLTARDSFMRVAVVETVTSNRVFTANDVLAPYEDHWFASGALTFETGANAGRTLEIKGWTQMTRTLELWEPARRAVQVGDQFRLYAGCSKRVRRGLPRQVPDPRQSPVRPWQRQEFSGRALRAGRRPGGAGAMTTTTLATAGTLGLTAAGGYLFGPLGAGAGALVGSFLFGGASQKVEGPRLGDLSVAASTYGGVIPVGFGTQKVAGTIIWATDIREEKHTNTQGGSLFGGGTKVVEYRYFASFAVALGEGPAGAVTRIWAGDKLIARLRSSDHAKANHPKYRFRIYLGTEDQQPDPLISKHVPANAAPAHRGLVYIVFEDLPLDEFGNRVPPITAEVSWAGAADAVANTAAINSSYQPDHFTIDPTHNRGFVRTGSTGNLVRLNLDTMTEEFRRPITEIYPGFPVHTNAGVVDPDGNLFTFATATSSRVIKIDGDSLAVAAEVATPSNGDHLEILSIYDLSGRTDWVLWVRFLSVDTRLYRTEDLSLYWAAPDGVSSRPRGSVAGRKDFGRAEAFVLASPSISLGQATAWVTMRHIVIEPPFFKDPITGDIPGLSFQDITLQASDFGFGTIVVHAPAYDAVNDRVLFMVNADGTSARYLVAYKVGEGIVWMVPVNDNDRLPQRGKVLVRADLDLWRSGGDRAQRRGRRRAVPADRLPARQQRRQGDVRPRQQCPLCRRRQPFRCLPDRRRPRIG